MPEGCLFCRIVAGEEPAHLVFEDEISLAFLDARPLFAGHSLLVPRDHHETLAELPGELVGPYFATAQLLSRSICDAMGAQGSFVAINNVVSQSVPPPAHARRPPGSQGRPAGLLLAAHQVRQRRARRRDRCAGPRGDRAPRALSRPRTPAPPRRPRRVSDSSGLSGGIRHSMVCPGFQPPTRLLRR